MTSSFSFNFQIDNDTSTLTEVAPAVTSTLTSTSATRNSVVENIEHGDTTTTGSSSRNHDNNDNDYDTVSTHHHHHPIILSSPSLAHPPPTSKSNTPKIPFRWIDIDYIKALLMERSQEELVYTDIPLSNENWTGSRNTHSHDDDMNQQQHQQQQHRQQFHPTTSIKCVDLSQSSYMQPSATTGTETEMTTSDIIPGIYEGGNKVWECSCDLVQYLLEQNITLSSSRDDYPTKTEIVTKSSEICEEDPTNASGIHHKPSSLYALELGCGHGLPGCFVLQQTLLLEKRNSTTTNTTFTSDHQTDVTVVFTDYNESVLLDATLSNIVLNTATTTFPAIMNTTDNTTFLMNELNDTDTSDTTVVDRIEHVAKHILFGGGDWMDMSQQIQQQNLNHEDGTDRTPSRQNSNTIGSTGSSSTSSHTNIHRLPVDGYFDLILASETIYTTSAAYEMVLLLQRHLRPTTGVAYIATKRYYFGVGGGVDVFRNFCRDTDDIHHNDHNHQHHPLQVETVKVIDNGTGNIREILRVQSKPVFII